MTKKDIWAKRWSDKLKNPWQSTSLDYYGINAFNVLKRYVKKTDKGILEIGSGTGRFCIALGEKYNDKDILGIDYEENAIFLSEKGAKLRNLENVSFKKADLFNLPFKDNSFDLVFENGVIEHFKNYHEAIKEMKRVTKKGGRIVINVNNWYCFPKTLEKKILGNFYPFGYEKSFKHKDIMKTFEELDLRNKEVYGYGPSNYLIRFFFFSQTIRRFVIMLSHGLESIVDAVLGKRFSKIFGYMIVGKGEK